MAAFAFLLATFLSAFLLFGVQPLASRSILPWFGGASSVWSAALLFFQTVLLAGYGWAHYIAARPQRRLGLHFLLLAGAVLYLLGAAWAWGTPLLPGAFWQPPDSGQPFLRILLILLAGVGLPYFVLSTTSPLLQSWFSRLYPGRTPYRLYALSNLGSFLALFSYPFLFEPRLTLRAQARLWSLAYLLYTALALLLAVKVRQSLKPRQPAAISDPRLAVGDQQPAMNHPKPTIFNQQFFWLALPACTSILLLAITNHLTQEVAVVPFLWVAPLGIYLLTFALAFAGERWYPRPPLIILLGIVTLLLAYAYRETAAIGALTQLLIYAAYLFVACLVLHGELYRLRPEPEHLTAFYFLVSLGGALGGVFVNLAAPLVFSGYWELPAGVLLCCVLVLFRLGSFRRRWNWLAVPLVIVVIALSGYLFAARIRTLLTGVQEMQRNFYGVYRVRRVWVGDPPLETNYLNHGITAHGFQYIQPDRRSLPTSYYSRTSGVGLALTTLRNRQAPAPQLNVGVIGLGTGTLAAYGRSGDRFRFYEINPDIIALARGRGGYFTYLSDSAADITVVPGDARLSLAAELEDEGGQEFDLLAVDAFSSDSIPVHLLTAEAFRLYLDHLAPDGVLAVHISNRYLDLAPLVRVQAGLYHLEPAVILASGDKAGASASNWVLLSRDPSLFRRPLVRRRAAPLAELSPGLRPWTDNYTNLLPYLRTDTLFKLP